MRTPALILVAALLASCATHDGQSRATSKGVTNDPVYASAKAPPLHPDRTIVEQDCTKPLLFSTGNLRCM